MGVQAVITAVERVGKATVNGLAEVGFAAALLLESLFWLGMGRFRRQPVRLGAIVTQAMEIGVTALPIVTIMSATIGVMLAIQGIYTLATFGAQGQVVVGVALSVTREFAPLITGIIVAGRSGSALAARLGSMRQSQEVDALTVMGINPVRFLVAPALLAAVVVIPLLSFWAMIAGLGAAGLYISLELGMSFNAYVLRTLEFISLDDLSHGLGKSVLFALLIVLIGVINGAQASGGAEGVGKSTTASNVETCIAILVLNLFLTMLLSLFI